MKKIRCIDKTNGKEYYLSEATTKNERFMAKNNLIIQDSSLVESKLESIEQCTTVNHVAYICAMNQPLYERKIVLQN